MVFGFTDFFPSTPQSSLDLPHDSRSLDSSVLVATVYSYPFGSLLFLSPRRLLFLSSSLHRATIFPLFTIW